MQSRYWVYKVYVYTLILFFSEFCKNKIETVYLISLFIPHNKLIWKILYLII